MSTIQATRKTLSRGNRSRIRRVALGALIAVGAAALILAISGTDHAIDPHAVVGGAQARTYTQSTRVPATPPAGYFRDPTTHALVRLQTAGRNTSPTLASVLAHLTPKQRQYVLGFASLGPAQFGAAFGTGR